MNQSVVFFLFITCKCCNKKLCNKENFKIKYKSPVGRCKKCGTEYIIPGCHEISLFEVKEAEFQIRGWIILSVFGALIALRGCHLFGMHELGSESDSHFMAWFITILGIGQPSDCRCGLLPLWRCSQ